MGAEKRGDDRGCVGVAILGTLGEAEVVEDW